MVNRNCGINDTMFGDYKGTLPVPLTGGRAKTGQVSPELVQLLGVRMQ